MGYRLPLGRNHQLSSASAVQSGALLYVYENATTTLASLYSDRACGTSAANPIVADSAGRFAMRYVAARSLLTLTCKTSAGVTLWTDDNIDPEVGANQALLVAGDTLTGALLEATRADIAAAATIDLSAATSNFVRATGSAATITSFGTVASGRFAIQFAGANTLTHNATSLILPGGANITTAANDIAVMRSLGSGNWICESYTPATGLAPALAGLTSSVAELNILDGVLATATEINRACDVSTRSVLAGSTLSVTEALHDGKIILFDQAAGSVCTLPAASGSGAVFEFATHTLATSNSHIVKVANATDIMVGSIVVTDAADNSNTVFSTTSTSDTITLNRTTSGSVRIGEMIKLVDIKTGFWAVSGNLVGTGGEATPFSATV